MFNSNITIVGLGMTTAVGFDHRTACASFRAGITRISKLDSFSYFDENENDTVKISAHVGSINSLDAEGVGKMLVLGLPAFDDLMTSSKSLVNQAELRTGFFLALPDMSVRLNEKESSYADKFREECDEYLIPRLLKVSDSHINIVATKIRYGDHCNFLFALQDGMSAIASGEVDRCIIGGIDSYLDELTLEWGISNKRIKTASNPAGFIPGEASIFILIENRQQAIDNGDNILAIISLPVIKQEKENEDVPSGGALNTAIQDVLENSDCTDIRCSVGNMNGEMSYAKEWGNVNSKLIRTYSSFKQANILFPVESFGEAGCANVGLFIGICIQAFNRKYAYADSTLVWCISDTTNRGAVLVTRDY